MKSGETINIDNFKWLGYKHFNSRAQVLFCAMVSGFNSAHVRANLPYLEDAIKYGLSAGDR